MAGEAGQGFTGARVLVTGASGIGAAAAARFHAAGAHVFVADADAKRVASLRADLDGVHGAAGDLADEDTARAVVDQALDALGGLDVLVNVAGMSGRRYGDGPAHEATAEGWEVVMRNNARSTFLMCRFALAPMRAQQRGVITNTGSVLAYAPGAAHFATHAYAASKGAIHALTRSMAATYAPEGIRVNAVAPGLIATPMSQRAQSDPAILDYLRGRQPVTGAPGEAGDVADAILYLASDQARFVTGTILEVAGGWSVAG
ncbi:MAG: SDR family oxidoreductase [Trueperaceae bacterium]|nr:SDR family oxidoreductase [Trueperaceae bacterium]